MSVEGAEQVVQAEADATDKGWKDAIVDDFGMVVKSTMCM